MKKLMVVFVTLTTLAFATSPLLAAQPVNSTTATQEVSTVATLNVNTATAIELNKLPGVGKKSAEAIIAYRTEKGKFKSPKDLLKVKGIGKKTLEKIQPLVNFE